MKIEFTARMTGLALLCCPLVVSAAETAPQQLSNRRLSPGTLSARADIETRKQALAGVNNWAIQLRYIDRDRLAQAPVDWSCWS